MRQIVMFFVVVLALVSSSACNRVSSPAAPSSAQHEIIFPNYYGLMQLPTRSQLDFTLTGSGTPSLPMGGGTLEKTPTTWRLVASNQPGGPYVILVEWNTGGNSTVTFRVVE